MSFLDNIGGLVSNVLAGGKGTAAESDHHEPNVPSATPSTPSGGGGGPAAGLGEKGLKALVDIFMDKKTPVQPSVPVDPSAPNQTVDKGDKFDLSDLARIAGEIIGGAAGGGQGGGGASAADGDKQPQPAGAGEAAAGGGGFNVGDLVGKIGGGGGFGDIFNNLIGGGGGGGGGGTPGNVPPPDPSAKPSDPHSTPQQPSAPGGFDLMAIINTILSGGGQAFGKVAIFNTIIQAIKGQGGSTKNSWLDIFAQKLAGGQQTGGAGGFMDIIVDQFLGNRKDGTMKTLLEKILNRKKEQSSPTEAEEISKIINKVQSNPDDPGLEEELRCVLVENKYSSKPPENADDSIPEDAGGEQIKILKHVGSN